MAVAWVAHPYVLSPVIKSCDSGHVYFLPLALGLDLAQTAKANTSATLAQC
jgi:hypothetical protein